MGIRGYCIAYPASSSLKLALDTGFNEEEGDFLRINRFNAKRHVRPIPCSCCCCESGDGMSRGKE